MPGSLRIHLHRPLPAELPRSCVFRRDPKGWSVALHFKLPPAARRRSTRHVGVDLGVLTFAALSDGGFIPSLRAARKAERRLRYLQRSLARKHPSSRGRNRAREETKKAHAAIARARVNHLHQAAARLVRDYDVIAIESLNVAAMASGFLAKHVLDASWGKFISMLRYKAEWAGARLVEVDKQGTSQECSSCGAEVPKELASRWHHCDVCGLCIDRDLNSARNILPRAGVGPGLHNANQPRAGESLGRATEVAETRPKAVYVG